MENREKDNYTVLVDVAESNENKKAKKDSNLSFKFKT